jgi:hypothetical protein
MKPHLPLVELVTGLGRRMTRHMPEDSESWVEMGVTRGGWGGGDGQAQRCVSSQNWMGYESIRRVMGGNETIKLNLWIVVPAIVVHALLFDCCEFEVGFVLGYGYDRVSLNV